MSRALLSLLPAAALLLAGGDAPPEAPKVPELFTARAGAFHVELKLEGLVEAAGAVPLRVDVQRTTELVVLEAAAQGAQVAAGDVVLRLDPKKVDEALEDQRAAALQAGLALKLAQQEGTALAARTALDLASAARALARAQEDLKRFEELERPRAVEGAEFGLKSTRDRLAYEEEELQQLERMYTDDDLTEETEEIVLRRQRDAVEAAQFQVRQAELGRGQTIEVQLPRQAEDIKEQVERARIDNDQAQASLPVKLEQKRAETRQHEREQKRAAQALAELEADRAALTIQAPSAGTVQYGPLERGCFPQAEALEAALKPHGQLAPQAVVMTIVPAGPLRIQAWVDEAETARELAGQACAVEAAALPGTIFPAHIAAVETQPHAERRHGVVIELDPTTQAVPLRPLWHVQARLIVYRAESVLTVPVGAVREDPLQPGRHLVYLPGAEGRPGTRSVKLGPRGPALVEVREGLNAGESILKTAPAEP